MSTVHEAVLGTVESWNDQDGWGVLRTPGGLSVFCHLLHLELPGQFGLRPGSSVFFDYEEPGQDGCDARVLTAARPAVLSGHNPPLMKASNPVGEDSTGTYESHLTITWDGAPGT